jgi:hypothetical protein
MGIIVNFTEETIVHFMPTYGTVEGIQGVRGFILLIDETKAQFAGNDEKWGHVSGNIDRVTGAVSAEWTPPGEGDPEGVEYSLKGVDYSLKCKPTQRMF